ncbi:MAG: hypothetical protein V1688_01070 [bacterium]
MNTKFYINTEANDDVAYKLAMKYACELAKNDSDIKRIVLYIHTKQNTGWFNRLFGYDTVKKLFNGLKFRDCSVPFQFETKLTYKNTMYDNASDIVICCGIDSSDILKIDDYSSAKYIIAIPWSRKLTEKWIKTWNAVEISGKEQNTETFPEPSCIVKLAMQQLTDSINMSNPMDNDRAKTFIKALYKYEPELNADIVGSYLVRKLNWETKHAKEIEKLIETLNNGRFFKGGEKTGLQNYYKRWKNECK